MHVATPGHVGFSGLDAEVHLGSRLGHGCNAESSGSGGVIGLHGDSRSHKAGDSLLLAVDKRGGVAVRRWLHEMRKRPNGLLTDRVRPIDPKRVRENVGVLQVLHRGRPPEYPVLRDVPVQTRLQAAAAAVVALDGRVWVCFTHAFAREDVGDAQVRFSIQPHQEGRPNVAARVMAEGAVAKLCLRVADAREDGTGARTGPVARWVFGIAVLVCAGAEPAGVVRDALNAPEQLGPAILTRQAAKRPEAADAVFRGLTLDADVTRVAHLRKSLHALAHEALGAASVRPACLNARIGGCVARLVVRAVARCNTLHAPIAVADPAGAVALTILINAALGASACCAQSLVVWTVRGCFAGNDALLILAHRVAATVRVFIALDAIERAGVGANLVLRRTLASVRKASAGQCLVGAPRGRCHNKCNPYHGQNRKESCAGVNPRGQPSEGLGRALGGDGVGGSMCGRLDRQVPPLRVGVAERVPGRPLGRIIPAPGLGAHGFRPFSCWNPRADPELFV